MGNRVVASLVKVCICCLLLEFRVKSEPENKQEHRAGTNDVELIVSNQNNSTANNIAQHQAVTNDIYLIDSDQTSATAYHIAQHQAVTNDIYLTNSHQNSPRADHIAQHVSQPIRTRNAQLRHAIRHRRYRMLQQDHFEKMKKSLITMVKNLCTIDNQLKKIQNQLQRSPATNSQQNRLYLNHMLDVCKTVSFDLCSLQLNSITTTITHENCHVVSVCA
ncbi:uncharacterized protein [Pocillopora verrucosa]|uniref:uncharacterized protein isoform X1 n=1 Tax=Pocillopora verrucosa TaxID=203993 RepID=UPI00333FDD0D